MPGETRTALGFGIAHHPNLAAGISDIETDGGADICRKSLPLDRPPGLLCRQAGIEALPTLAAVSGAWAAGLPAGLVRG